MLSSLLNELVYWTGIADGKDTTHSGRVRAISYDHSQDEFLFVVLVELSDGTFDALNATTVRTKPTKEAA